MAEVTPSAQGEIDLLIVGAGELATPLGREPRAGAALAAVHVVTQAALAVDGGRIVDVGTSCDLRERWSAREVLDARGGTLVPGFVDAHTHPVFATTREDEFAARSRGATYLEIAAAGGGILSTVRGVRAASDELLRARLDLHLDRFLELGTTTVEAKTGYGLSLRDELRCLESLAAAQRSHSVRVVPTFLGAHEVPEEFRGRKGDFVREVCEAMLPAVAERGLARYFDAFVESHVFGLDDARAMGERARSLGLGLRLHVDQLSPLGGAELAAELGAASADHLEHVSERGIEALAGARVVPVLCPVVPLYLRQTREAPARRMVEAGLAPALSTDFNPGSCYLQSLPEALTWAALRYGFSAGECLTAATLNAACSLGLGEEIGSLEVGKRADIALLDVPNHRHLVYELGRNPVRAVVAGGRVAWRRAGGA
jgi:imidazolonepropionase